MKLAGVGLMLIGAGVFVGCAFGLHWGWYFLALPGAALEAAWLARRFTTPKTYWDVVKSRILRDYAAWRLTQPKS